MPWIDAPDPREPVWRVVLGAGVVTLFLAWAALPIASDLWSAMRAGEVESGVDLLADGGVLEP